MAAGAVIYVCGNASTMAPGVRAALTDMFKAKTGGARTRRRRNGWPGCDRPIAIWRTSGARWRWRCDRFGEQRRDRRRGGTARAQGRARAGESVRSRPAEPSSECDQVGRRIRADLQTEHTELHPSHRLRPRPRERGLRRCPIRQVHRGWAGGAVQGCGRPRPLHVQDRGSALAACPRDLDGAVQHAGDGAIRAENAGHRGSTDQQVGTSQPGRLCRSTRRHDQPHLGHDRPMRVRLPVQLVLPGNAASVRVGHDPHAARVPGPGPPDADQDSVAGAREAAARRRPGLHGGLDRRNHPANADNLATPRTTPTSWAGCWKAGIRTLVSGWTTRTSAINASPSSSPGTRPPVAYCPSRPISC